MTYSPPVDQVVHEDGMASPLVTWEDGRPVAGASPPAGTDNPEAHEREVRCWDEIDKLAAISANVTISSNVLFLHERRDQKGRRWLVALLFNGRSVDRLDIAQLILSPEGSGSGIHYTSGDALMILPPEYLRDQHGLEQPTKKLTLFAGQPDPKDSSRFSVRFRLGEYTGHIDYVLRGRPSEKSSDEPYLDFAGGNYIYFDQPAPADAQKAKR
jgi:hypothetical protein